MIGTKVSRFGFHNIIILIGAILSVSIIAGCSSQKLFPVQDEGSISNQIKSITKTEDEITITVLASEWDGDPDNLKRYLTPIYIEIKNDTSSNVAFDYGNMALITDDQTQYNPLSPENAAGILLSFDFRTGTDIVLASSIRSRSFNKSRRFRSRGFHRGFGFSRFHSPFYYPYYNPGFYNSRNVDVSDILAKAITSGSIRPGATLKGYVYFQKISDGINTLKLQIPYTIEGEQKQREIVFPFAVQVSSR